MSVNCPVPKLKDIDAEWVKVSTAIKKITIKKCKLKTRRKNGVTINRRKWHVALKNYIKFIDANAKKNFFFFQTEKQIIHKSEKKLSLKYLKYRNGEILTEHHENLKNGKNIL